MTSSRPYLIRAIYEWLLDNDMTPHILVDVEGPDVIVPMEFVEDNKIILNISPTAVQNLELGNSIISFSARFSGKPMNVMIPVTNASALYARENGQGMVFTLEPEKANEKEPEKQENSARTPVKPTLKIVK